MKKILASLFTISILTVSNAAFAAIGYVDYSYISKNYPLAQKYTQTLKTKNTAIMTYAKQKDNINPIDFPTCRTFDRYLKSQVPEQAIYLARYGLSAWNKKYASYISRDYSELKAGTCWVSDHAQIDVAVSFEGTVCFLRKVRRRRCNSRRPSCFRSCPLPC